MSSNKRKHAMRLFMPVGLRQRRRRRYLLDHFGLVALGSDESHVISPDSRFGSNCRVGARVHIARSTFGDYTYVEADSRVLHTSVGKFSSIANFVQIGLARHPLGKAVSTHPAFYLAQPSIGYSFVDEDLRSEFQGTSLGSDVWVGAGSCVLDGIRVADGAVVGAGSVVTHDVPPYAIIAGAPARVLRFRFDPETIQFLLGFRWWDRSDDWLRENVGLLQDVAALRRWR